ncbi:unnamed protein product, partial [Adineta steineri]
YKEILYHNFNQPDFTPNTNRYTQIVWRDTKKFDSVIAFTKQDTKMYFVP